MFHSVKIIHFDRRHASPNSKLMFFLRVKQRSIPVYSMYNYVNSRLTKKGVESSLTSITNMHDLFAGMQFDRQRGYNII